MKQSQLILLVMGLTIGLSACGKIPAEQTESNISVADKTNNSSTNTQDVATQDKNQDKPQKENSSESKEVTRKPLSEYSEAEISAILDERGSELLSSEIFGQLKLGLTVDEVVKILGEPSKKGEKYNLEATGEFSQDYIYETKGLTVDIGGESADKEIVRAITIEAPSQLKSSNGIGINSSVDEFKSAYEGYFDPNDTSYKDGSGSLIAGSIYGGMFVDFTNGKVTRIFLGAGAE